MADQNIYNQLAHDGLVAAGFTFVDHPACWEDAWDGGGGPKVVGNPAYNEYDHREEGLRIYIGSDGMFLDAERYDPKMEAEMDACYAAQNEDWQTE